MRILVINPFGNTEFYGEENLNRIKRPDTEFDFVNIAEVYPLHNNQWLYFKYMCTDGTLEKVMWAEDQGYDGVFISCNLDIGLYEARQLVNIPVTATLESAALMAHMMGVRFSLLSVDYQNGEIQRSLLKQYGLDGKLASVRSFDIDANDLYLDKTSPEEIVERVTGVARRCVQQDGAELLIPGCTLAGSVLTHNVGDPVAAVGAPVLDGMVTGFKLAEMMVDLQQKAGIPPVSRVGFFEQPPVADFTKLRSFIGRRADIGPGRKRAELQMAH